MIGSKLQDRVTETSMITKFISENMAIVLVAPDARNMGNINYSNPIKTSTSLQNNTNCDSKENT